MKTIQSASGKEYNAETLLNLARQIIPNIGDLSGGIYGTQGETVGFRYSDVQGLLGKTPTPGDQVVLDMAKNLIDLGIQDINNIKVKDVIGTTDVVPIRNDVTGQIEGYQRWIGDQEGYGQWRRLTPEESSNVKVESYGDGEKYVAKNIPIAKGFYAGDRLLSSSPLGIENLQQNIGETYSGPGMTGYRIVADPTTGKPKFTTYGSDTGESGLIKAALTMGALALGAGYLPQIGAAGTGAAAGGGAAELASVGATGYGLTGPISTVAVPSAFDAAVTSALDGGSSLGSFGPVGTGGFGTAIPTAAETAASLTAAGFAPGTAANLAGMTQAGVGAAGTGASALSTTDVLRGLNTARQLLGGSQQQPQAQPTQQAEQGQRALGVDYSGLLNLLASQAKTSGLLGTQYQPTSINISSLLG